MIETLGVSNRAEAAGLLADLELGQRAPQIGAAEAVPGFGGRAARAMLPLPRRLTIKRARGFRSRDPAQRLDDARGVSLQRGRIRDVPRVELELDALASAG